MRASNWTTAPAPSPCGRRTRSPWNPTEDDPHPAPKLGEEYDDTPRDFGRLAAATARQVISQLFRKAEDDKIFGAFSGQRGKLITGVVQQDAKDTANVHIAVGDVEASCRAASRCPGSATATASVCACTWSTWRAG